MGIGEEILWDCDWHQSSFHQILLPSRIDSFAQESTPRSDITHCPSLSVLMEEAGELERGIFSTEVEFHTFSEMIFQFLLFFPPFFLLMVLGVSGLSQT